VNKLSLVGTHISHYQVKNALYKWLNISSGSFRHWTKINTLKFSRSAKENLFRMRILTLNGLQRYGGMPVNKCVQQTPCKEKRGEKNEIFRKSSLRELAGFNSNQQNGAIKT
jgi:hypothetical protein